MPRDERHTETIPYGTLGIIPLASCTEMGGESSVRMRILLPLILQDIRETVILLTLRLLDSVQEKERAFL